MKSDELGLAYRQGPVELTLTIAAIGNNDLPDLSHSKQGASIARALCMVISTRWAELIKAPTGVPLRDSSLTEQSRV